MEIPACIFFSVDNNVCEYAFEIKGLDSENFVRNWISKIIFMVACIYTILIYEILVYGVK